MLQQIHVEAGKRKEKKTRDMKYEQQNNVKKRLVNNLRNEKTSEESVPF